MERQAFVISHGDDYRNFYVEEVFDTLQKAQEYVESLVSNDEMAEDMQRAYKGLTLTPQMKASFTWYHTNDTHWVKGDGNGEYYEIVQKEIK